MPVTPKYILSQDHEFVYIKINVPYIRVSSAEIDIDKKDFAFYCQPYLLKLKFPHELVDNDNAKADYDPHVDNGTLTIRAPKEKAGTHFEDLDLPTKFLLPPMKFDPDELRDNNETSSLEGVASDVAIRAALQRMQEDEDEEEYTSSGARKAAFEATFRMLRENPKFFGNDSIKHTLDENGNIISSESSNPALSRKGKLIEELDENGKAIVKDEITTPNVASTMSDKNTDQTVPVPNTAAPSMVPQNLPKYGFNRSFSGFFKDLREELQSSLVSLPFPDQLPSSARRAIRFITEEKAFDPEHYAGDYVYGSEDPILEEMQSFHPFWVKAIQQSIESSSRDDSVFSRCAELFQEAESKQSSWEQWERDELTHLHPKEYFVDFISSITGKRNDSARKKFTKKGSSGAFLIRESQVAPTSRAAGHGEEASDATEGGPTENVEISPRDWTLSWERKHRPQRYRLLMGLLALLPAAAYDIRFTGNDTNPESAETLAQLSPLLSWLDDEFFLPPDVKSLLRLGEEDPSASGSVSETRSGVGSDEDADSEGELSDSVLSRAMSRLLLNPSTTGNGKSSLSLLDEHGNAPDSPELDVLTENSTHHAGIQLIASADASDTLEGESNKSASSGALATQEELERAVYCSLRRLLLYSYLRRWDLASLCVMDASTLLLSGRASVLRALLYIHYVLRHDDVRYLLNTLFIGDYCVWIQTLPSWLLPKFGAEVATVVHQLRLDHPSLEHWDLLDIHAQIEAAQEDEEGEENSEDEDNSDSSDSE